MNQTDSQKCGFVESFVVIWLIYSQGMCNCIRLAWFLVDAHVGQDIEIETLIAFEERFCLVFIVKHCNKHVYVNLYYATSMFFSLFLGIHASLYVWYVM